MRKLVHFVGMKRAGNHAVLPWMEKNIFSQPDRGTVIHINDVCSGYTEASNMARPAGISITSSSPNLVALLSYEDKPLSLIPKLPPVARPHEVMTDVTVQTMLLLRDPYNAFASRMARLRGTEGTVYATAEKNQEWDETVELWKSYAREFLGKTNTLGGIIPVNYNRWVSDKGYRDGFLRDNFGQTENLDHGKEEVASHGNGSSFDGRSFDGRASEMDVLGRWKLFQDDPFYKSLFKDQELVSLSCEIFGPISGTEIIHGGVYGTGKERG